MRSILRLNKVVLCGTLNELKQRIKDGETYGRLPSCPMCGQLTLKTQMDNPEIIVCSGTIANESGSDSFRYCSYTEMAQTIGRSGFWLGRTYFIKRVEENDKLENELKLRKQFDKYILNAKDIQANRMMNTYEANTVFASVGDIVRVKIDKRDRISHPCIYKYIVGVVYARSLTLFAYVVTTVGVFAKKSTGVGRKGLTPFTFSPRDYVLAKHYNTVAYDVQELQNSVINGSFDLNHHQYLTSAGIRSSMLRKDGYV